jgi:thiamine-monophosphate kinase
MDSLSYKTFIASSCKCFIPKVATLAYRGLGLNTIGELGERRLIDIMLKHFTPMPDAPIPFRDDVSGVRLEGGKATILKTDMLIWDTDVPPGMTPFQASRKTVVMNFSDLASKGVRPMAFLVSLGLPRSLPVEIVEEMAEGFEAGAREYGAYVVGGDTNESKDVVVSGMAYGVAEEKKLMKRDGAKPEDILATTGFFGKTAAALKGLLEGYEIPLRLRPSLLASVYMPEAKVEEGVALAESGSVSASMDSSDGLAISLHDLSRSSGFGFRVNTLPVSPEAEEFANLHRLSLSDLILHGGEEYELIFTIKPDKLNAARKALEGVGCQLIEIGEVISQKSIYYMDKGVEKRIKPIGWEHFKVL